MRHMVKVGALVCVLALAAGCGDDGDNSDGTSSAGDTPSASASSSSPSATDAEPSESPSADESSRAPVPGTVISISFKGGRVTPNGERVEARAGEPVTFEIDADAPGELHVHSTPDHEIEFEAGTSSHEVVIDQPGIVEVELHEPEIVVVQLELR